MGFFGGWRRSNIRLALLMGFYLFYLILGASIFSAIESPVERTRVKLLRQFREAFLRDNYCVTDEALESLIVEVVQANNHGVSAIRNVTMEPNWSFGQALFFAGTIVTTIGYGHVSPLSDAGKGFCILYAIIGIPATLVMITAVVERLMTLTTSLLHILNSRFGHLYQPFHIRMSHLVIVVFAVTVLFFLVPAGIFANIEPKWNYLDSLYYCFISLTTIGLGDYIPGDSPDQINRALYKVTTTFYLLFGLTLMMLVLAVMYEIPQLNFGLHFMLLSDEREAEVERMRLKAGVAVQGPKYTQHMDDSLPNTTTPSPVSTEGGGP